MRGERAMRRMVAGALASAVLGGGIGLGLAAAPASAAPLAPVADCVAYTVYVQHPPPYPVGLGSYFSWYAPLAHDAC